MTAWVLWTWDATGSKWREARAGSMDRMTALASERQTQADELNIAGAKFVALPTGKQPDDALIPGALPLESDITEQALTHFWHCWRFPDHHACAVALIERQAAEYDELLVRADRAERALRVPA